MDTDREQLRQQIREQAQAIATRVKSDPEFHQRLKADPARTLAEEGIPERAIPDLLRENMPNDEVSGYMVSNPECGLLTCIITHSVGCHLTI